MHKVLSTIGVAALCAAGFAAYAVAQPKAAQMQCSHECPMHGAAELSDIKVEQTKQGAVIHLVAKRAEDVGKVQQSAQKLMGMLNGQQCPMHAHHGGMQHGGMHHGGMQQPHKH
jgi:D-lyxose ketol-isomerase